MNKILKFTLLGLLGLFVLSVLSSLFYLYMLSSELPSIKDLKHYKYRTPSTVYDRKGRIVAEIGDERRYPLSFEDIPEYMKNAVISVEDSRFYKHGGVDFLGIIRAFFANIKAGKVVEGGSTLTQQLVKVIYLTPERKLKRKLKEAILAYKIDNYLTKDEILGLYLNEVYFGRGAYGVEAAAKNYFGKSLKELSLPEIATIAGIPKAPGIYAPHIDIKKSAVRMEHVLYRMFEEGYITEQVYNEAKTAQISVVDEVPRKILSAPYFVDMVKDYLKYELKIDSENNGYKIYTTIDIDYQKNAEKALTDNLFNLSKRQGYFGVLTSVSSPDFETKINKKRYLEKYDIYPAMVVSLDRTFAEVELMGDKKKVILELKNNNWAFPYDSGDRVLDDFRKIFQEGDIVLVKNYPKKGYLLEQEPVVESALLATNPENGDILSVVGGFDYNKSMFNRAVSSKRQVGSLFKPIVYSAALENGFFVNTQVLDAPVIMDAGEENKYWKPLNFENKFYGFTTLSEALTKSRNIVTIKIAEKLGVNRIIDYAKRFGISSDFQKDLSISIGSGAVSLLEMVGAFSVFPNMGSYVKPRFVLKVYDYLGNEIYTAPEVVKIPILKEATAQIMTDMLINVVENGTGRRASVLNRYVGGKTGTTNDYRDAWFVGFLPNLTVGVWTGFDDFKTIGKLETGSRAALPAWVDYVRSVMSDIPFEVFSSSKDVVYYKIDKQSHQKTDDVSDNYYFAPFDEPVKENNSTINN